MRLNRFLSDAGVCSRREADRLIEAGKVCVDGKVAELGTVITEGQKVSVNDEIVEGGNAKVVIAYNKPIGIECTADKDNKDNIIDAVNYPTRLFTIGRLDKNSCGLILLTNDGELANQISKAGEGHEKEYYVRVDKPIADEILQSMEKGVPILGKKTAPCKIKRKSENCFTIILIQGLNRQIRRMCEYYGFRVRYLKRVRVMNISLGNIEPGKYRQLTQSEIKELYKKV